MGTGEQWMSWVHLDDLVRLLVTALTDTSFSGVYNGTAPNPVRMSDFCSKLGAAMGRPSWLPVPDFALQVWCLLPVACRYVVFRRVDPVSRYWLTAQRLASMCTGRLCIVLSDAYSLVLNSL